MRRRELKPLARALRAVPGTREPLSLQATPEIRLIRRETYIRDALLQLSRHLDEDLRQRSHDAALALGAEPARARALAAAVTILEAVETGRHTADGGDTAALDTAYLLQEIHAVSAALRSPDEITAVRARAAVPAESMSTHD